VGIDEDLNIIFEGGKFKHTKTDLRYFIILLEKMLEIKQHLPRSAELELMEIVGTLC